MTSGPAGQGYDVCLSVMVMDNDDDDNRIDWGWASLASKPLELGPPLFCCCIAVSAAVVP